MLHQYIHQYNPQSSCCTCNRPVTAAAVATPSPPHHCICIITTTAQGTSQQLASLQTTPKAVAAKLGASTQKSSQQYPDSSWAQPVVLPALKCWLLSCLLPGQLLHPVVFFGRHKLLKALELLKPSRNTFAICAPCNRQVQTCTYSLLSVKQDFMHCRAAKNSTAKESHEVNPFQT